MTIVGGFRYPSPSANAVPSPKDRIVNVGVFSVSGLADTAALAVCLYVWNPAISKWEPMTQP